MLDSLPELARMTGSLFDRHEACAYSCYSGIRQPKQGDDPKSQKLLQVVPEGQLWPDDNDPVIPPQGEVAHDMLRAYILGEYYPCVGARAAFAKGTYRFGFYKRMSHLTAVAAMGRDLRRFVKEYEELGDFTTFIAVFKHPQLCSEEEFEDQLWGHLQALHDHDIDDWDPHYSCNPKEKNFGFSFHGKAFFVVGMNPGASRFSRRFTFPVLVFNPESQIRKLKEQGGLEHFANTVRTRDTLFQGTINPSLPTDSSTTGGEARVFSGRAHRDGDGWECPFRPRRSVVELCKKRTEQS
jgi:FPC/CPF motif-containing protein YcgG